MIQNPPSRLERRLAQLERSTRVLGAAVVVLAALLLVAARPRAAIDELVQAERVQLVDREGRVRLDLRHDSTETGLFIIDQAGDTRLGAAQFAHGGGGFALHGPQMKGTAVLYLKGSGTLSFYDSAGVKLAQFPRE